MPPYIPWGLIMIKSSLFRQACVGAITAAACLVAGLPAYAQSPVQAMKLDMAQSNASASDPADVAAFKSLIENENKFLSKTKWEDLSSDAQGVSISGLKMKSSLIGKINADEMYISGIQSEGDIFTIDEVKFVNISGKDKGGETFSAETMTYGPVTVDVTDPKKSSMALTGEDLPENASLFSLKFKDKTDEFSIDFLGWQASTTGEGHFVGLSNMAGTSKDPELDSPMQLSISEITIDGIDSDGLAHLANYGNDLTDFDVAEFDFRHADFKQFIVEDEDIDVSLSGGRMTKTVTGALHEQALDLDTIRFNFKNEDDADLKEVFQMLGTSEFIMRGSFHSEYNADTQVLSSERNNFEIQDWFNLGLTYVMSDISEDEFIEASSFSAMMKDLDNDEDSFEGDIDTINLTLTDLSGMDKLINIYAKTQSVKPNDARQQLIAMISLFTMMPGETPELTELTRSAGNALTSFISRGGKLTFEMDPEPALGSDEIDELSKSKDPMALFNRMGLRVSHAEPL